MKMFGVTLDTVGRSKDIGIDIQLIVDIQYFP